MLKTKEHLEAAKADLEKTETEIAEIKEQEGVQAATDKMNELATELRPLKEAFREAKSEYTYHLTGFNIKTKALVKKRNDLINEIKSYVEPELDEEMDGVPEEG